MILARAGLLFSQLALVSWGHLLAQCPDGTAPPCPEARASAVAAPNSVAVLYFDNLSRDTADAFLVDGLTEAIIDRLARVPRLSVKSREAVRRLRDRRLENPTAIGRGLHATYLVGGSVRRSGEGLRVTVELSRTATGDRVWGEQYDRTENDLFRIESDIATAVAGAIVGRLLPPGRGSNSASP